MKKLQITMVLLFTTIVSSFFLCCGNSKQNMTRTTISEEKEGSQIDASNYDEKEISDNEEVNSDAKEEISLVKYLDEKKFSYRVEAYEEGNEDSQPIIAAAVATEIETGYSSSIFILTEFGVACAVVNSGSPTFYRPEDGFAIEGNTLHFSMDVPGTSGKTEIYDYILTVRLEKVTDGAFDIVIANNEILRE
ncbi:MAG: hypothetical protein K6G72_11355 [Lachnospiraceae bacterium]|nr:hypothetical protein [Lachnospiraceae bacterium]